MPGHKCGRLVEARLQNLIPFRVSVLIPIAFLSEPCFDELQKTREGLLEEFLIFGVSVDSPGQRCQQRGAQVV